MVSADDLKPGADELRQQTSAEQQTRDGLD
jgi:hypothetical protein